MFSRFLSKIFWVLITALAVPTTLILISWDAVPGDSTYAIKTNMEQAVLAMALSTSSKSNLQIKYTERRFDEVEKVLSQNSDYVDESLTNFNQQLIVSKNSLDQIENLNDQEIQTQKLIDTLQVVSQKIQQQKQVASTSLSQPQSPPQINHPVSNNYQPTIIPTVNHIYSQPAPTLIPRQATVVPTIYYPPVSTPTVYSPPTYVHTPDPTIVPPSQPIDIQQNPTDNISNLSSTSDITDQATPAATDIFIKLEETSQQIDQIIQELNQSQQNRGNHHNSNNRGSRNNNGHQDEDD
jgi:hypothetical protein